MSKKRKIIISVSIFVSAILIFATCYLCLGLYSNKEQGEDSYSTNIKTINKYNYPIVLYGDEVKFRDGVKYKKSTKISESPFKNNTFLVINDRSSTVSLDDEDYISLVEDFTYCSRTFIYIGGSKLAFFKERGFIGEYNDDCLGFMISTFSSKVTMNIWNSASEEIFKTNDDYLGEKIVSYIASELENYYFYESD